MALCFGGDWKESIKDDHPLCFGGDWWENCEEYEKEEEIEHPYADIKTMVEDKRRKAEQMRKTVFAKITASLEVLAEKLVFPTWDGAFSWESTIIPTVRFSSRAEAIAATVKKLNEVCDDTK